MSPDGNVREFKKGIGMIADRTGAPLYPVGITGMNDVLPPGRKLPKRAHVRVRFGAPLEYVGEGYGQFAGKLETAVRDLKSSR